jgi:arylsulfatase A-like enzyme
MGDGQIADWAAERLKKKHDQPVFIGVGFYRPHIPLFAPKKYFDLYTGLDIQLPTVKNNDLADLSPTGRKWALEANTAGAHETVVKHNQWQAAVLGYLACISFIDAQIGKLLDALASGPNADNTVIVLWGDHGWHLGEKQHWGKWTGWQRSTHVPLIIAPPRSDAANVYQTDAKCYEPVSLIDVYPTLIDLCGLPPRDGLSGHSLAPLLKNPKQTTNRVVTTTFDQGNYSITGARWHYIRYADGNEELYDSQSDPHEWSNLAAEEKHRGIIADLRKHLPNSAAR